MFTQVPNNLSSLYSELTYTYHSSSSGDITLQIYEDQSDELLGVKKFYSTSTAQVNIAPHIRPYAMPSIDLYSMGFITPYRNGNVSVYLKKVGESATSTVRQFTLSRGDVAVGEIITSLPNMRCISDGESEQIYISAVEGEPINVEVKRYLTPWSDSYERPYIGGEFTEETTSTENFTTTPSDGNIEVFNFVAQASGEGDGSDIERCVVTISQSGERIGQIAYQIVESPKGAVRLAWVSEYGSIEHYTFPSVRRSAVDDEKGRSTVLGSAFEGYATRKALTEIVRSPLVWMLSEGEYKEVEAADGAISVDSAEALGCVEVNILCNG